jgi:exosome complex RNA-binding protein Csl4
MPEAGLRYLCEREAERRKDRTPSFIVRARVLAHPNTSTQLAEQLRELGVVAEPSMVRYFMNQRQGSS